MATPTALAIILNNLSQVYVGTATGPLSQVTVQSMVAPPVNPATGQLPTNDSDSHWFGLGLDIYASIVSGESWERFGSLDGTSSFMERSANGTILVATFNSRMNQNENGYVSQLQKIVTAALFSPPLANNQTVKTTSGTPVKINLLANDYDPNTGAFLNPASIVIGTQPADGSLAINTTNGVVVYTPTSKTFTGTDSFTYTISDTLGETSNVATVTIDIGPSIIATGLSFSVFPGLPLNNVVVATFIDSNPATPEPSATINWGNGQTSTGTVNPTGSPNIFTVSSSFAYSPAIAAQYVSGTGIPVAVTITDTSNATGTLVGTANSSAVLLNTGTGTPFTGGLAAIPANGPNASGGYATSGEPTFSGTPPPSSIVDLNAFSSTGVAVSLGHAVATSTGQWSLPSGSILLDGSYTVTATVIIAGLFQSGTINLSPIIVDSIPPQIAENFPAFTSTGNVLLEFDDSSGMNTSNLLMRGNYTVYGRGLAPFHPKGVILDTPDNPGNPMPEVTLILNLRPRQVSRIKARRNLRDQLRALGTSGVTVNVGVTDNAGNSFQGSSRIPFGRASGPPAKKLVVKPAPHGRRS